jgi:hypothetical protein
LATGSATGAALIPAAPSARSKMKSREKSIFRDVCGEECDVKVAKILDWSE